MGSRLEQNSAAVRKRIESHAFSDETGDEYEASEFGGFGDYFRRKKIKLQNLDAALRESARDKIPIFKGVVAHVSGYTQPSLQVELVQHGAGFLQYLDGKTMATHIIASYVTPKKAIELKHYRVVKPAWVMDSIKAGKMLAWSDYAVIGDGPRQKTIRFDGGKMPSQSTRQSPQSYRQESQNSFYTNQLQRPPYVQDHPTRSSPFRPSSLGKQRSSDVEEIEDGDAEFDESAGDDMTDRQKPEEPSPQVRDRIETNTSVKRSSAKSSPSILGSRTVADAGTAGDSPKAKATRSEEHNVQLLADAHISKSTTANPDFLKQYYSESRLHHLSRWKAELKSQMQKLAAEKGPVFGGIKRKTDTRRYIMHVDFDSFFCAVSLKRAPEYVDKAAAVAHGNGTGSEIASCNYPARKLGVKNGMWMKRALELCPDLKVLPYDFPAYEAASRVFYDSLLDVGGTVQSVSIDEALIDLTDLVLADTGSEGDSVNEGSVCREQEKVEEIATSLRERIKNKTGCDVSVGIGGNILLAKVALRKAKPAGQFQIRPEEVLDMVGELRVEELPGVAYSIGGKLEEMGIKLVKEMRQTSRERLVAGLGAKTGERLWEYARGIDLVQVGEQPVRKSVSAEVNWGIRFLNQGEAEDFVRNLAKELERRLLKERVRGRKLTMKMMKRAPGAPLEPSKHLGHGKCETFNKSIVFGVATNEGRWLGEEAVKILGSYQFSPGDLRGLGLQLSKLEPVKSWTAPDGSQKKLTFAGPKTGTVRKQKQVADPIQEGSPTEAARAWKEVEKSRDGSSRDPISTDALTPRKPSLHPAHALTKSREADEKAKTPLNISGTQFIMPSHPDAAVMAELPADIRARLVKQAGRPRPEKSRSPARRQDIPSGIDREVFEALPEDVKAEVLASYRRPTRQPKQQSLSPQSPRKDRIIYRPKERTTPSKQGVSKASERERRHDAQAGLLQTTFATRLQRGRDTAEPEPDEPDPAILAELPEDVRLEILADRRRRRPASHSRLSVQRPNQQQAYRPADPAPLPGEQTRLRFPAPPPRVRFTGSSLTGAAEMKDMMTAWHGETQGSGPHEADVQVLSHYLHRLVVEERDMDKARRLVISLGLLVREGGDGKGKVAWERALALVKQTVQDAMTERGLGPMDLEC